MKKILCLFTIVSFFLLAGCKEENSTNNSDDNDGKTNPLTSQGLVCKVDGVEVKFEECQILPHTPVADYLTITSPNSTVLQLRTLPDAKGTYKNTEGENTFRRYNVWFTYEGKFYQANNDVGSSTITLTDVGKMNAAGASYSGNIKGNFSGTFVADDNTQIVVTDGFFFATDPNE